MGQWLNKNRNCQSQGRQRRIGQAARLGSEAANERIMTESLRDLASDQTRTLVQEGLSDPSQRGESMIASSALDVTKLGGDINKLSEEEKALLLRHSRSKVNPGQVTNQVLKLCGVVRQKLDVHGGGDFTKKRSGLGGTGGRQLSPELRIRFGTYGFKNKRRGGN